MAKQTKLNRMTAAALFSALTVILQLIATFIKFGPFSITLALAPIIVGAAVYGKGFGALLGTVLGMMRAFMEMAAGNFEGVKQMQMAGGIAEAMITTVGGLVLAIPSVAAYVFFRSRIQKHITDMEVAITHILTVISVQMDHESRLSNTYRLGRGKEVMEEDE